MEYESLGLLHEMFCRQVSATPDRIALAGEDGTKLTFRELDHHVDVLARALREKGVTPDTPICIHMEKCPNYAIAQIAILKAGGAYLPLDISYPRSLIESIAEDCSPLAIITTTEFTQKIKDFFANIIVLDAGWLEELDKQTELRSLTPLAGHTLDSLAFIAYSSGTTGKPKGIMCPHRGAVFSYHWRHENSPYGENEREAVNVFFVWEMMRPLIKGVPVYVIPDSVIYDPVLLCEFLSRNEITRMLFTPSLLEAVLNTDGIDFALAFKTMRLIVFCGEVVTTSLFQRCLKLLPWVEFLNLYSISESHDVAGENLNQYYNNNKDELTKTKFCPVGKLLPGVKIMILNSERQPQPVGVSGEIAIGGPTLARGYLKRPELNKQKFIDWSNRPGGDTTRLYLSGDWGYILSNQRLEICGRCDTMVKVRGYSIEVQAVEAALMELTSVNACVVVVKGGEGEDKFLVAYIVPQGETTKKEIRATLKQSLPFYMIPSYFVFLNSIPILASSGKLDKKALPAFDKQSETSMELEGMPTTEMERRIAPLWAEVLDLKNIDIQESFFDLGGHSLLAPVLMGRMKACVGVELTVKDLFLHPTVYSMARLIEHRQAPQGDETPEVLPRLDLAKEVDRHDQGIVNIDMQLRAFWRSFHYGDRWKKGRVLLTGATGFLGAFVLKELLLQTKTHVYCIVRKHPDVEVKERVLSKLRQYGILERQVEQPTEEQTRLKEKFHEMVTVIKGDVSLVNLGMDPEDYTYLCTEIDFVIHCAASVNLVYPYIALQAANVRGTENTVLFACSGKIKPIHYISTDAVFPHGMSSCSETTDVTKLHPQLDDGYAQSKWVAEQLVSRAGQRGIPVVIYRLGNMAGDSMTAHWNPLDFTLLILQACARLGVAPQLRWNVEMTPVDFAASAVVGLTQNLQLSIGKVFHIVNTQPLDSRWLFEWMDNHGYPLSFCSYSQWCDRVRQEVSEDSDIGLLKQLVDSTLREESYFSRLSVFDNKEFQQVLAQLGLRYPSLDSRQLQRYFQCLATRGVMPKPRVKTSHFYKKPLSGLVAVVTGASSGIGAAISTTLAEAGAQVAMAARRTDRLEANKAAIEKFGGTAICVKTDVTNREQVVALVRHVECTLGPVDILVNNAGVMYYTHMRNLHTHEWEKTIDVNCKGVVNGVGAVLEKMLERGKGHIVNMSSNAGRKAFAGLAVYSGSKFFVEGFSQALRQEVCKSGIKVTCVQPGDVKTELVSLSTDKDAVAAYDGSESTEILQTDDIAKAVLYAVTQPSYVGVNEILVEPREAPA